MVDNTAWETDVVGLTVEIDAVTSAVYGSLLDVSSEVITEMAISWGTSPTASVSSDYLTTTVSGSTNDTGIVYIAW